MRIGGLRPPRKSEICIPREGGAVEKRRDTTGETGGPTVFGEALEAPEAGWIPPFLLLALRENERHEEDLVLELVFLGFDTSRAETIRRALREMEAEGMVVGQEPAGTPLGRRFGITHSGEDYLQAWANSLALYRDEVDFLLGLYDRAPVPVGCGPNAPL